MSFVFANHHDDTNPENLPSVTEHTGTLVLVCGSNPLVGLGGHSSYVRAHGRAALRVGYTPHIFCVGPADEEIRTDFGVIHQARSPYRPYGAVMLHAHAPRLIRSIGKFLKPRQRPHLVHGFGGWSYIGAIVAERLKKRDIPAVLLSSGYDTLLNEARAKRAGLERAHGLLERLSGEFEFYWKRFVLDRCERRGYVSAKMVLVNYESVRRILVSSYGSAVESKIRLIPYTSGNVFNQNEGTARPALPEAISGLEPKDAPLLVSVSRQDPRKGLNIFLHALARLRDEGIRFRACLVGGGPLIEAHRQLARNLGLEKSVAAPGFVPDPFAYLRHADVFVLPSLEEGSGSLSLIEALQAGVPVVASGIDGIPEDVTNGSDALLVPPNDVGKLAEALRKIMDDAGLRERLARQGRETFRKRFSADRFTTALAGIYSEVLKTAGE
jgi:glycosyltransferase involved in cell wall biosynthesis